MLYFQPNHIHKRQSLPLLYDYIDRGAFGDHEGEDQLIQYTSYFKVSFITSNRLTIAVQS